MRTAAVRRVLSGGRCVKRYGLRSNHTHDYFDKVLSRKGAAPAPVSGYPACRGGETGHPENRLAGLPT